MGEREEQKFLVKLFYAFFCFAINLEYKHNPDK